ncbi:hypothetical protein Y032_1072g3540 [Ancylostoma ceylanicum]|nr:hypothetical protein Y032_1072g3540 [Ancylostoma ceylanicum]
MFLDMPAEVNVPLTTYERLQKYQLRCRIDTIFVFSTSNNLMLGFSQYFLKFWEEFSSALRHPDSPDWFNKEINEKLKKDLIWAAPYDARFPQVRKQRQCFAYYVDFHRCNELMGSDYKPCKFFQNVYKDICPGFWLEKWDELMEEGRFPAKFDR